MINETRENSLEKASSTMRHNTTSVDLPKIEKTSKVGLLTNLNPIRAQKEDKLRPFPEPLERMPRTKI